MQLGRLRNTIAKGPNVNKPPPGFRFIFKKNFFSGQYKDLILNRFTRSIFCLILSFCSGFRRIVMHLVKDSAKEFSVTFLDSF